MTGTFTTDNDLAGANNAYNLMLVVDKAFQWSFPLPRILDTGISRRNLFGNPRMTMPIVCDVEDFDHLVGLREGRRAARRPPLVPRLGPPNYA